VSALGAAIADRIADRLVGIRKPRVTSVQVSTAGDGRVAVTVVTLAGSVSFEEVEADA